MSRAVVDVKCVIEGRPGQPPVVIVDRVPLQLVAALLLVAHANHEGRPMQVFIDGKRLGEQISPAR